MFSPASKSRLTHQGLELFHGTYLLFNFPGETPATTRETQEFVESIASFRKGFYGV